MSLNEQEERKYFFFSFFSPKGPMQGLWEGVSRVELIFNMFQSGCVFLTAEELSKEDYDMLREKIKTSQSLIIPSQSISPGFQM